MRLRVFVLLAGVALLGVASPPVADPLQSARAWYAVIGPGSGSAVAFDYGTLGGSRPYEEGYAMLDSGFRAKESLTAFLTGFARTAYIRLGQAELMEADEASATVFVEDERDMHLEGLPATVRYFGHVRLTRVL